MMNDADPETVLELFITFTPFQIMNFFSRLFFTTFFFTPFLSQLFFSKLLFPLADDERRRPRNGAGMAADRAGRGAGHATAGLGAALHDAAHER